MCVFAGWGRRSRRQSDCHYHQSSRWQVEEQQGAAAQALEPQKEVVKTTKDELHRRHKLHGAMFGWVKLSAGRVDLNAWIGFPTATACSSFWTAPKLSCSW